MMRLGLVLSALGAAIRNENVRRVELAWGAAIAAEWAHFVALGVFAYEQGGAAAVGVAGLVRCCRRRARPVRCVAGRPFPSRALSPGVAVARVSWRSPHRPRRPSPTHEAGVRVRTVVGVSSTLVRPALQALLPSLARTPEELIASNGATSTVESLGTLFGPLLAGVLVSLANVGVVFLVGAAVLLVGAALLARVKVEGRDSLAAVGDDRDDAANGRGRVPGDRAVAESSAARGSPPLRPSSAGA